MDTSLNMECGEEKTGLLFRNRESSLLSGRPAVSRFLGPGLASTRLCSARELCLASSVQFTLGVGRIPSIKELNLKQKSLSWKVVKLWHVLGETIQKLASL